MAPEIRPASRGSPTQVETLAVMDAHSPPRRLSEWKKSSSFGSERSEWTHLQTSEVSTSLRPRALPPPTEAHLAARPRVVAPRRSSAAAPHAPCARETRSLLHDAPSPIRDAASLLHGAAPPLHGAAHPSSDAGDRHQRASWQPAVVFSGFRCGRVSPHSRVRPRRGRAGKECSPRSLAPTARNAKAGRCS